MQLVAVLNSPGAYAVSLQQYAQIASFEETQVAEITSGMVSELALQPHCFFLVGFFVFSAF